MGSEKFCLRWNDFESNISNAFKELRDDKDFFDVTLACEDEQIQGHKVILAACSPFFRNILRRNPHQHPMLYMKGVKYTDLQAVLNFMYHGEVNVAQEELNSFLSVAEDLKVKGLTQNQSSSHQREIEQDTTQKSRSMPTVSRTQKRNTENEPHPLPKQTYRQPPFQDDDDIQEVVSIKSEPVPPVPIASPCVPMLVQPKAYTIAPQPVVMDTSEEQTVVTYQEDTGYEDYGDYQDQVYTEADSMTDSGKGMYQCSNYLCMSYIFFL